MTSQNNSENLKQSETIISLWADLHRQKQKLWLPVLSGSMLPMLCIGDRVLVQTVEPGNIRFSDIIVFKSADKLVVHRIIKKYSSDGKSFLQKGDNARVADIVRGENIIGRVTAVNRNNKIICLNDSKWKVYNFILTFLSWSAFFLRPKNPYLRNIAKIYYKKTKEFLNNV